MRIAISGAHRTGKSTLVEALAARLPSYSSVPEPYWAMTEDGYDFAHPPTPEDFAAQLDRSLADLSDHAGDNVIFDRCPLDALAYLLCLDDDSFDLEAYLPRIAEALETLDLVIFVPIERPDRITVSEAEDEVQLREAVDEKLQDLLLDDPYDLGVDLLQVQGNVEARVSKVLQRVR